MQPAAVMTATFNLRLISGWYYKGLHLLSRSDNLDYPSGMRSLIEIVILGTVVALAWEKPIREQVGELVPALAAKKPATTAKRATPVATTNASNGDWMWDPNRRSVLDRPAYDAKERPPAVVDEYGRRYWADAQGRRHYDR